MFHKFISYLICLLFLVCAVSQAGVVKSGEPIDVTIKGVPADEQTKINGKYVVTNGGLIYMPLLVQGIRANGVSSSELARRIEGAYKAAGIYTNPRITIFTARDEAERQTLTVKTLTVGGYVRRPSQVPFRDNMTLFDAVQAAGGANEFGSLKRVKLIRKGKMREYNLKVDKNKLIPVYPNDSIEIPQKTWLGN